MIKRAVSADEFSALPENGVEAQKIRSLLMAYGTKYDFCRFYLAENAFIAQLNGDFIVCGDGETDAAEFAEFLGFCGFSSVFCSKKLGEVLSKKLGSDAKIVNLMRFDRNVVNYGSDIVTPKTLSPSEAYSVIKTGFEIEFEPWYLDMSHRVRHNISRLYGLCGSALAVQYAVNGEALISQVATLPDQRGKGFASRLILSVCGELRDYSVYVLCENELTGFYRKNGFAIKDYKCCIYKSNP